MGQLGFPELLIIAVIALLIFGPKKLPELGSGLGKAIRDFKRAVNETTSDLQTHSEDGDSDGSPMDVESQRAADSRAKSSDIGTASSKPKHVITGGDTARPKS